MNLLIPHDFEANYVLGFAKGLAANGVEFTVVSSDDTELRLIAAGIPQINIRGSIDPARPKWKKALNLARYYAHLFWLIFRDRGFTVHFNGLFTNRIILFDGIVLPFWIRLWSERFVYTAHNLLPHDRDNSRFFFWVYRLIYSLPHDIIAHTNKVADQLSSEFHVRPSKITVISIGLNEEIEETHLSFREARKLLELPEGGQIGLFFGKVEPYKGVDRLAEAWGIVKTPATRLLIAGWCPDTGYAHLVHSAIAKSPRKASIQWREGFVANGLVAVWLRACNVVVMPYRNIYQSGVVFLCLRFGVPIVATDVGSLSEFIDSESGIIAQTNDPAGIATALDQFFLNPARFRREEIANRAQRYLWVAQCQRIRHLYQ
jgi:glycosyltransferase involved in cell wall biosynthesis